MKRGSAVIFLAYALTLLGCATSSSNLKPSELAPDKGAFFGHVQIFNQAEDITSSCYVEFTDKDDHRKQYTSLDKTGWVFTTGVPGETYLSMGICTIGGFFKKNIHFNTRDLKFNISDQNTIAYFGHVVIRMNDDGSVPVAAYMLGGAVGGAIAGANAAKTTAHAFDVSNKFEEATNEYRQRYGESAERLKLMNRVIVVKSDSKPMDRAPASK